MENYTQEERYLEVKKRVKKIKGFYTHLIVYIVFNIPILFMIYSAYDLKSNFWNFGSFSTLFFWGIGLLIHALSVFGPTISIFKEWEERKLAQFIKEEETQKYE